MNWPHLESSFQGTHWPRGLRLPLAWQSVAFLCCVGVSQKKWCALLAKHSERLCFRVCVWVSAIDSFYTFKCQSFAVHELTMQCPKYMKCVWSWLQTAWDVGPGIARLMSSRCLWALVYTYTGTASELLWVFVIHTCMPTFAYIIKQNHLRIIAILWLRCLDHCTAESSASFPHRSHLYEFPGPHGSSVDGWHVQPAEHVDPKPGERTKPTAVPMPFWWISESTPKKNKGGKRDISQWKQLGFPSVFYI